MPTLDEIETLWAQDAKIDRSNLDGEALKIPELHNKYYKIFLRERIILQKREGEVAELKKTKWEYYSGKLDDSVIEQNKWNKLDILILPKDIERYMDADRDLIDLKLNVGLQREKVDFLKEIISNLNTRNFLISNAVNFIKWSQGNG